MDSESVLDSSELSRKSLCFLIGLCFPVVDSQICRTIHVNCIGVQVANRFHRQFLPLCRVSVVGHFLYSGYSAYYSPFVAISPDSARGNPFHF
jgi:hypothetical protein